MMEVQSQFYYIVDTAGNYYRLSEENQLLPTANEEEVDTFSFPEANARIGTGKKSHFILSFR